VSIPASLHLTLAHTPCCAAADVTDARYINTFAGVGAAQLAGRITAAARRVCYSEQLLFCY